MCMCGGRTLLLMIKWGVKVSKVLEVLRILVQASSYDGIKELSFISETTMYFYDKHLLKRFAVFDSVT